MLKEFITKRAKRVGEFVYKNLEEGSGNMILATSMTAIGLSTLAQTIAIFINKKYSLSQKAFMVPQEITEGVITILSMFCITKPIQGLSGKLVKTGKIATTDMIKYMNMHGLLEKRGKSDFDFKKIVNSIIKNIETSDKFIKSSSKEQKKLLENHNNAIHLYEITADATSAIATTAGSVLTTALISPLIRNVSASYYQQHNIDLYNKISPKYNTHRLKFQPKFSYLQKAYGYESDNLKI